MNSLNGNSLNGNSSHESVQPWSSRYPYQTYEKGYWDGYRKRYDELHKLKARKDIWIPWICGIGLMFFVWSFRPDQAAENRYHVGYAVEELRSAGRSITAETIAQQMDKDNAEQAPDSDAHDSTSPYLQ